MSLLDLDEWLFDLASRAELVYGPFIDAKEFPEGVDIALVEGAVSNEDNRLLLKTIRSRSRTLVALGDCAVMANVTGLRNTCGGAGPVLTRAFLDPTFEGPAVPYSPGLLPMLEDPVRPIHSFVHVDWFLPGCPPSGTAIRSVLTALFDGETPNLSVEQRRFG